jgi:hypothetical protein
VLEAIPLLQSAALPPVPDVVVDPEALVDPEVLVDPAPPAPVLVDPDAVTAEALVALGDVAPPAPAPVDVVPTPPCAPQATMPATAPNPQMVENRMGMAPS